jgi:hypothetical protein
MRSVFYAQLIVFLQLILRRIHKMEDNYGAIGTLCLFHVYVIYLQKLQKACTLSHRLA